jgi:antitoxin PrlF
MKLVSINERGTLTLPKDMRQRLGVDRGGEVIAEEMEGGILLRAGAIFPIEIYSETRIAEFNKHNDEALADYRLKKKKSKK